MPKKTILSMSHLLNFIGLLCCLSMTDATLGASQALSKAVKQCADASFIGDVSKVQQLLMQYGDALACLPDDDGITPLMIASFMGHDSIVRLLLDRGASVNRVRQANGATALYMAVAEDHAKSVQLLLAAGADPACGQQQIPVLVLSADCGYIQVVKLLLAAGAYPDVADEQGLTALMMASQKGHVQVAEQLLCAGASLEAQCLVAGHSALAYAALHGQEEIAILLLEHDANIENRSHNKCTPLQIAIDHGHDQIVCLLLCEGAEIAATREDEVTALELAALKGQSRSIELLAAAGADFGDGRDGVVALEFALYNLQVAAVRTLVKLGAAYHFTQQGTLILDCLLGDKFLRNASWAQQKQRSLARLLFERGLSEYTTEQLAALDITAEQAESIMARLHTAFMRGCRAQIDDEHMDCLSRIAYQVSTFAGGSLAQDCVAKQCVLAADDGNLPRLRRLIAQYGNSLADMNYKNMTPLIAAAYQGRKEAIMLLLDAGADYDATDEQGLTALMMASQKGHVQVAEWLLCAGANLEAQCVVAGHSALTYAAWCGQEEIVTLLLKHGANIENRSHNGITPLLVASEHEHDQIVCQLLLAGADVNMVVNGEFSGLYLAARIGQAPIVELLAAAGAAVDRDDALSDYLTPLRTSIRNGHDKVAKTLLSLGAHPDGNAQGKSLLDCLLEYKADVENDMTDQTREQELPKPPR